ncbi:uncharacterized protein LOC141629571 [Silene latifolia]|uniref:uncharacterized protein LOC141629571 n=1 Tax=Silene latifolia TaxID=37657 RepID=UPI003D786D86
MINKLAQVVDDLRAEVVSLQNGESGGAGRKNTPRVKIPEPPKYSGDRDSKTIDNFLWSMERYFQNVLVEDDKMKIGTATLYLTEDAILWWRRREIDIQRDACTIDTWEEFMADFKKQFYPENAAELASKKLRNLKQTGSIREYIKQFTTPLLQIDGMPESLSLLYFKDGLQRWAKEEIKLRGVKTLSDAIAVAESLYESSSEPNKGSSKNSKGNDGGRYASDRSRPTGERTSYDSKGDDRGKSKEKSQRK